MLTKKEAVAASVRNGVIARENGALYDHLDSIWAMEMNYGDWESILSAISPDEAKYSYSEGLEGSSDGYDDYEGEEG